MMIMTTTDTVPQHYSILGVVMAANRGLNPMKPHWTMKGQQEDITLNARAALTDLEREAIRLGADAVIGIRYSNVFGNNNLVTGTAIKFVAAQAGSASV